jgi:hypothetical protein
MAKRKRGPSKRKKGDAEELTYDDAEPSSTQTFTFLGSSSGRKDRTTYVQGSHGVPDVPQLPVSPGLASDAALPDPGLNWLSDGATFDDGVSEYDDDFSVAFDATEIHFGDDDVVVEDVQTKEAGKEKEIMAGVSMHFSSVKP